MTVVDFLLPVFVLIGLTFVLLFIMARERVGSLRRGEVKTEDIALRDPSLLGALTSIRKTGHLERDSFFDNFRAAVRWALDGGETEFALRFLAALWRFAEIRGYFDEWRKTAGFLPTAVTAARSLGRAPGRCLSGRNAPI